MWQAEAAQQQENSLEALTTAMMDAKAKEDEAAGSGQLLCRRCLEPCQGLPSERPRCDDIEIY